MPFSLFKLVAHFSRTLLKLDPTHPHTVQSIPMPQHQWWGRVLHRMLCDKVVLNTMWHPGPKSAAIKNQKLSKIKTNTAEIFGLILNVPVVMDFVILIFLIYDEI